MGEKPFKPLDQQVALLERRGLLIRDRDSAAAYLLDHNYYRLSGYMRSFQVDPTLAKPRFVEGTSFEDVVTAYRSDCRLTNVLFRPLGQVERALRTRIAYFAGEILGDDAFYLERENYFKLGNVDDTIEKIHRDLSRSKSPTVNRYSTSRSGGRDFSTVPIWVAVEVMSFGCLSQMFQKLDCPELRHKVAHSFSWRESIFSETIHSFVGLRNKCAHHSQLWNRTLEAQCPKYPGKHLRSAPKHSPHGLYPAIVALKLMMQRLKIDDGFDLDISEFIDEGNPRASGYLRPKFR